MSSSVQTEKKTETEPGQRLFPRIGVLYSSWSAQPENITLASGIMRSSRERNEACGINGALVFDGEVFAQFLHGDKAGVRALQTSIWKDNRHCAILLLHDGPVPADSTPTRWRAGWAPLDALKVFRRAPTAQEDKLAEFLALLPAFDLL